MRRILLTSKRPAGVPAFVSAGAGTATLSAIAKPAGVVAGDTFLLLLLSTITGATFTPPAGFNLTASVTGTSGKASLYYRTATGAEGATFSASGSGGDLMGRCFAYRNISPVDRAHSTNAGPTTSMGYAAVASASGDAVIGIGVSLVSNTCTTPAGHTERVDGTTVSSFTTFTVQLVDLIPAAGAAGAVTSTLSSLSQWLTLRAAFPPA